MAIRRFTRSSAKNLSGESNPMISYEHNCYVKDYLITLLFFRFTMETDP